MLKTGIVRFDLEGQLTVTVVRQSADVGGRGRTLEDELSRRMTGLLDIRTWHSEIRTAGSARTSGVAASAKLAADPEGMIRIRALTCHMGGVR